MAFIKTRQITANMREVRAKTYMLAEHIRIMALYGATIGNLLKGTDNKTVSR